MTDSKRKFCGKCGTVVADDTDSFCTACGASLGKTTKPNASVEIDATTPVRFHDFSDMGEVNNYIASLDATGKLGQEINSIVSSVARNMQEHGRYEEISSDQGHLQILIELHTQVIIFYEQHALLENYIPDVETLFNSVLGYIDGRSGEEWT